MVPLMGVIMMAGVMMAILPQPAEAAPEPEPAGFRCPYCGLLFDTMSELTAHINEEHPGETLPPSEPSALLVQYQQALEEAYIAVEAGYLDSQVMIPGYGLQYANSAIPQLNTLMVEEAINIGMITSSTDAYFVRAVMYFSDGTTIVPYWWACPYCTEKFRSPALLQAHLETAHWEIINSKGTIIGFVLDAVCYDPPICDIWHAVGVNITWRNDSPFTIRGHVAIVEYMSYGGTLTPAATSGQDAILSPGQSVTVQFSYTYQVTKSLVTLTRIDGPWPGLVLAQKEY